MAEVVIGLFTFQNGDIEAVDEQVNGNLDVNTMPLSGPKEALIFDFDGVAKTINLTGRITDATTTRVTGSSILTITQQKDYLEALLNGYQEALAFTSTFVSSTYVWIMAMTFKETAGSPNILDFTMNLQVGSQ